MSTPQSILRVYETGPRVVIGFGEGCHLGELDIEESRKEISQLLKQHNSQVLAIDLTGVQVVPSAVLGLWASIHRNGVAVHLYNASAELREVLEITRLSQLLQLKDGHP